MAYSYAGGCNNTFQVYGAGIVLILGSFAVGIYNTDGVPTAVKGKGYSAVNTSAGLYTLTFTNSALSVLSCWAQVQMNATTIDMYAQLGAIDVVTALTAKIQLKTGATNTDPPAANANNRVHFGFYMATSSLNN